MCKLVMENQRYVNAGTNALPPKKPSNLRISGHYTHTQCSGDRYYQFPRQLSPAYSNFQSWAYLPHTVSQTRMVTSALDATALGEGLMNIDKKKFNPLE